MVTVFIWCLLYVLNHKERLHETESVVALILMALIALLIIPIIGLTSFHIFLVSRGRTTNEQVCFLSMIIKNKINLILLYYLFLDNW